MSFIKESKVKASNSPVNKSTSKMLYSFSKEARFFPHLSENTKTLIYDLPNSLSKIKYSFSKNPKMKIPLNKNPAPGDYTIDRSKKWVYPTSLYATSFIKSLKSDYLKQAEYADFGEKRASPGPGAYNSKELASQKYFWSLHSRLQGKNNSLFYINEVPGPGSYHIKDELCTNKTNVISKYKNEETPLFNKASKRFIQAKDSSNFPGPGKYKINSEMKPNYKNSKNYKNQKNDKNDKNYQRIKSRHYKNLSFISKKELARSCFKDLIKNSFVPGPGSYLNFSEWGQYYYKNKDEQKKMLGHNNKKQICSRSTCYIKKD